MQYEQPVTLPVTLVYLSIHITGQHPPVLAQGRQKGWIFENSIWIGCFSHAALFFLVSWRILLPARSWSCWWSDLVAYCTSLEDFGFLSSASVDFPTSHLCSLKSSFYCRAVLVLWVCVCVSLFFICAFPLLDAGSLVVFHSGNLVWLTSMITLSCFCLLTAYTSFFSVSACIVPGLGPGRWVCWQNLLMENIGSDGETAFWHSWPSSCGSPALPETQRHRVHET